MTFEPFDNITRAKVTSEKGDDKYIVDLLENKGVGSCSCAHFQIRLNPKLRELTADPLNKDEYRCKHLLWYRDKLAGNLLEAFISAKLAEEKFKPVTSFPPGTKLKFKN